MLTHTHEYHRAISRPLLGIIVKHFHWRAKICTVFAQVEKELREICQDILDVLDKHLIPSR